MEESKESVYSVVRDQTGLGITGDTVVGSLQGVAVVLNAPTRLGADKPLPSGGEEGPLQAAVRGQEGDAAGRDYRGHKVLSAFRNLPTLGWGLEVKIDESEVLAPLAGERRTLFRLAALGLPLVLGAALLAARSVSKPIVRLTREVRTISGGDLDRQVPVEGEDEVGELSVAFNAMTADLSRSYTMLQESRKRIVVAQDEARRKMERDIHDGAQQQLVSIAVKLGLVKMLLTKDMDKATGMLDQLKVETTDALNALRDLARGLFPPLLQEKGMVTALEAHIAKMEINATVDASSLAHIRFTPDIEVAVYFCLREAIQNASKYAPEAPITICFTLPDDGLHFVCKDEGPGFDTETAKRGSGTQNMLDRIEALGGTLELISAPGEGTSIVGRIPVTVLEPAESTDESPPDSSPGDGVLASGVRP
jgi:signal transduction histidine kinase